MSPVKTLKPAVASDADVFSISDAHLAQRYRFIREIGAGNWGCVWLCSPKNQGSARIAAKTDERVAVKLVFREKKPTTAQRVRSLWNEMKVVRALKNDPHPSIIPFHSFIITPSFAIIIMDYLPYLIPVEVPEYKARDWFRSLLSAVEFLHVRGIVHNDIKPANILLSTKKVPVLVDFGFAERYETGSKRAFLSNLAYGTPEYLSPERARGNTHDTRKSDMWSLGITFFEILIGRTPFEYVEGEKLMTQADLEDYWARTVKGRWIGKWKMSSGAERFLRGLIAPTADLRATATEAMRDPYWTDDLDDELTNEDMYMMSSPAVIKAPSRHPVIEHSTPRRAEHSKPATPKRNVIATEGRAAGNARRRIHHNALTPIQGSPNIQRVAAHKSYAPSSTQSPQAIGPRARAPIKRKPVPRFDENAPPTPSREKGNKSAKETGRKTNVLADSTTRVRNNANEQLVPATSPNSKLEEVKVIDKDKRFGSGSYARVKAFERLKQLERSRFLEEDDFDYDAEPTTSKKVSDIGEDELPKPRSGPTNQISVTEFSARSDDRSVTEIDFNRPRTADSSFTLLSDYKGTVDEVRPETGMHVLGDKALAALNARKHANDSNMTVFKHSFKLSLEKFSTIGRTGTLKNGRRASEDLQTHLQVSHPESWESKTLVRDAVKSSLPGVEHALLNEESTADHELDRLTLWMRNVEEVVKEAKENFASSSVTPLPSLPAPPVMKNGRVSRSSRKILAVDQIFQTDTVSPGKEDTKGQPKILPVPGPSTSKQIQVNNARPIIGQSPGRARRATFSSGPVLGVENDNTNDLELSPSKRREKAKSSGNLSSLLGPISPFSVLQREVEKTNDNRISNLNEVLDRSVFVAKTSTSTPLSETTPDIHRPTKESSSMRTTGVTAIASGPNSPTLANVLRESSSSPILNNNGNGDFSNRFVLGADSLARIKRNSRQASVSERFSSPKIPKVIGRNSGSFLSGNLNLNRSSSSRPLQISSPILIDASTPLATMKFDDSMTMPMSMSMSMSFTTSTGSFKDDASKSVSAVRKAFKAIVAGRSVNRRTSKLL